MKHCQVCWSNNLISWTRTWAQSYKTVGSTKGQCGIVGCVQACSRFQLQEGSPSIAHCTIYSIPTFSSVWISYWQSHWASWPCCMKISEKKCSDNNSVSLLRLIPHCVNQRHWHNDHMTVSLPPSYSCIILTTGVTKLVSLEPTLWESILRDM